MQADSKSKRSLDHVDSLLSRFCLLPIQIARRFREKGFVDVVTTSGDRLYERYRDWRLGIHTLGVIMSSELGFDTKCHDYEGSDYRCLDRAFRYAMKRHDDIVFLDYGAGKGRAVAVAATYPFRRVIGVEKHPDLSDIARQNIRRAEKKFKCENVEIVTEDATRFQVPSDVNVILVFNPFSGDVLAAVEQQIRESLTRNPRKITLLFLYPPHFEENPFDTSSWLVRQCEISTGLSSELKFVVYETEGLSVDCHEDLCIANTSA